MMCLGHNVTLLLSIEGIWLGVQNPYPQNYRSTTAGLFIKIFIFVISNSPDYMEEKVGQEIDIESSIATVTKLEKDDKRIVFHPKKRCLMN
jgi:hypothetical protein